MLTIARTGGVDLKTVSGLPSGPGPASAPASAVTMVPKIIIVKDPTGSSICASEIFAEEIPIGSATFPTALKFYIDTTEDLSKPAPGKLWGTRVPPVVQFRDRLIEIILQKIDPLTSKLSAATPSTNVAKQSDEDRIKSTYIEFLKIFKEDMTSLRTSYKESDVSMLSDYLNEKFQRSLRKALEVDEMRHAMKHGKSALVSTAAGALSARNVAVKQAAEESERARLLRKEVQDLSSRLGKAEGADKAKMAARMKLLQDELAEQKWRVTTFKSISEELGLEKKGKAAEAEYNSLTSQRGTLGDILKVIPSIEPQGDPTWRDTLKTNINIKFDELFPTNATSKMEKYQQWINKVDVYKRITATITTKQAEYNALPSPITTPEEAVIKRDYEFLQGKISQMDDSHALLHSTTFNEILQTLDILPTMQTGGGYRRATRHRAHRNRAKTQRRLRR